MAYTTLDKLSAVFIFNICCFAKLKDGEFRYFFLLKFCDKSKTLLIFEFTVTVPNFASISRTVAEIWPFFEFPRWRVWTGKTSVLERR